MGIAPRPPHLIPMIQVPSVGKHIMQRRPALLHNYARKVSSKLIDDMSLKYSFIAGSNNFVIVITEGLNSLQIPMAHNTMADSALCVNP